MKAINIGNRRDFNILDFFFIYVRMCLPGAFTRKCKICALVGTTSVLSMLAYAATDNEFGNVEPDAVIRDDVDPVWILLPLSGAVMLLSWRRFSRAKR
jgi:hypothetical protein